MKDLNLLVWVTQLGLSVAAPLAGFVLLAVWLRDSCGWGGWVIWAGLILGALCAFSGLRSCLRTLSRLSGEKPDGKDKDGGEPPAAFNDHD